MIFLRRETQNHQLVYYGLEDEGDKGQTPKEMMMAELLAEGQQWRQYQHENLNRSGNVKVN